MQMRLFAYHLPLKRRFGISRGAYDVQPTLIVELEHDGLRGYGEATANEYYGHTLGSVARSLAAVRPEIEAWSPGEHPARSPAALWSRLAPRLGRDSFAQCALDLAAHDLWGKLLGQPLHRLWGLSLERVPASNFTLGLDQPQVMRAKLEETPDWPIYKIKLGGGQDLETLRELRRATDAVFRVDVNCGWDVATALRLAPALPDLNVEFVEQPLPPEERDGMRRLLTELPNLFVADESCQVEADVERCCGYFHGVNIKLVKCGGLTPARRMIARARELKLRVMVGCMTESTVGISAIAQLLPLLDYVDMDGAELLAEDVALGAKVVRGVCQFPTGNGCGIELLRPGEAL